MEYNENKLPNIVKVNFIDLYDKNSIKRILDSSYKLDNQKGTLP